MLLRAFAFTATLCSLLTFAWAETTANPGPDGRPPNPAPNGEQPPGTPPTWNGNTVKLRNTHYYVVLESLYDKDVRTAPILDLAGNELVRVSPRFKAAMDIEGTGRLVDGRVLNYAGVRNKEIRYLFTEAKWGLGVGSCQLRPFKSIAVDPKVIPLGSSVYIAETDGMLLPDGTRHNGVWRAHDIGGAIKNDRVDLFVGDGDRGDILRAAGITNLKPLTVTLVRRPGPESCVNQAHPKQQ